MRLVVITSAFAIDGAIQGKKCERVVARAGKGIVVVIWNEDMDDIRIKKSLENLSVLIDGVSKTVKHEIKNRKIQENGFLGILLATLGASILGNMLTGKCVIRVRKDVVRGRRGCNNMDMDKSF